MASRKKSASARRNSTSSPGRGGILTAAPFGPIAPAVDGNAVLLRWLAALSGGAVLAVTCAVLLIAGGPWGVIPAALAVACVVHAGARGSLRVVAPTSAAIVGAGVAWAYWAFSLTRLQTEYLPAATATYKDSTQGWVSQYIEPLITSSTPLHTPIAMTLTIGVVCSLVVSAAWYLLSKRLPARLASRSLALAALVACAAIIVLGATQPAVVAEMKAPSLNGAHDAWLYRATFERMQTGEGYYKAYLESAKLDRRLANGVIKDDKFTSFLASPAQMRQPYIFYAWRLVSPRGSFGVFVLAIVLSIALLFIAYWALEPRMGAWAAVAGLLLVPVMQSTIAWVGIFLPDWWAGVLMAISVLLWIRRWPIPAVILAGCASVARETALFLLFIYIAYQLYAFVRTRRDWVPLIVSLATMVAFWGLFFLHSSNAAPMIASQQGSTSNIVGMLTAAKGLDFATRFVAPASFLATLWWMALIIPPVFLFAQVPGWCWALWKDWTAFVPVVGIAALWVVYTLAIGTVSAYWGMVFMPLAYIGSGMLVGMLGWYAVSGKGARIPAEEPARD